MPSIQNQTIQQINVETGRGNRAQGADTNISRLQSSPTGATSTGRVTRIARNTALVVGSALAGAVLWGAPAAGLGYYADKTSFIDKKVPIGQGDHPSPNFDHVYEPVQLGTHMIPLGGAFAAGGAVAGGVFAATKISQQPQGTDNPSQRTDNSDNV